MQANRKKAIQNYSAKVRKLNQENKITKKPKSRLGQSKVYDLKNHRYLQLSESFIVNAVKPGCFIGGSRDGSYYLHLEEVNAKYCHLPNIYIQNEANFMLYSIGPEQKLSLKDIIRPCEGIVGEQEADAYIALKTVDVTTSYLITIASAKTMKPNMLEKYLKVFLNHFKIINL